MSNGHSLQAEAGNPYQQTVASLTALFQSTEDLIWSVDLKAQLLYGIDLTTGGTRFSLPLDVGPPEHFATAAVAAGMIVVAGSTAVEAFR